MSSGCIAATMAHEARRRAGPRIEVESPDESKQWLDGFAVVRSKMPEVMEVYRMAGDVDYLLRISVANMAAYDDFYQRLIDEVPLKNVTSRFAMERVKYTTAYPIADA